MPEAYSAYIELDAPDVSEEVIEALFVDLEDCSPSVAIAPNGNLSVRLFVQADNVQHGVTTAIATVQSAAASHHIAPATVAAVEVITEAELDRRLAEPAVPTLAGLAEIAEILGVTKQRAQKVAGLPAFPPAVQPLMAGPVYVRDQVIAFETSWVRTTGRPVTRLDLTDLERTILLFLAGRSRDDSSKQLVGGIASPTGALAAVVTNVSDALTEGSSSSDRPHFFYRPPASSAEIDAALAGLRDKKLIGVRQDRSTPAGHQDEFVVSLTEKGQRQAHLLES